MNSNTETTATAQAAVAAEQGAHVAPKEAAATRKPTPKKKATKGRTRVKAANPGTKKAAVLDMLPEGRRHSGRDHEGHRLAAAHGSWLLGGSPGTT
jgi:hypothetical protein